MVKMAKIEVLFEMGRAEMAIALAKAASQDPSISAEALIGLSACRSGRGLPPELAAKMASPERLASLTPLRFARPSSLHCGSALEACLDCHDAKAGLAILAALPFKLPRSALAAAIRRSDGAPQAAARLARAAEAGMADAALLRMLISRSGWCSNGVASVARAESQRRAMAKAAKAPARSAPRRARI